MNGSDLNKLRKPRRSWKKTKPFEELYNIIGECWIWLGSVHTHGVPIYKGWKSARQVSVSKAGLDTDPAVRVLRSPSCGNKLCIAPKHLTEPLL